MVNTLATTISLNMLLQVILIALIFTFGLGVADSKLSKVSRLVLFALTLISLSIYFYVRLNIPTEVIR